MMYIRGRNALPAMGAALGQAQGPAQAVSYQQAFDAAFAACSGLIGEAECRRLLGYAPFLCPPPQQKPLTSNWWFWLLVGLLAGKVIL